MRARIFTSAPRHRATPLGPCARSGPAAACQPHHPVMGLRCGATAAAAAAGQNTHLLPSYRAAAAAAAMRVICMRPLPRTVAVQCHVADDALPPREEGIGGPPGAVEGAAMLPTAPTTAVGTAEHRLRHHVGRPDPRLPAKVAFLVAWATCGAGCYVALSGRDPGSLPEVRPS